MARDAAGAVRSPRNTYSHAPHTSRLRRARYLAGLLGNSLRGVRSGQRAAVEAASRRVDALLAKIETARRAAGQPNPERIAGIRILEIGYGQRCVDALILHSLGARYIGLDVDVATHRLSPAVALRIVRNAGYLRFFKSLVRHLAFDRSHYAALRAALRLRGVTLRTSGLDLRVCSADAIDGWADRFDVIYSTDVFEHLRPDILQRTVVALAGRLVDRGCCVITVNHFAGITGGHSPDWASTTLSDTNRRRSEPWNHLRHPGCASGDTYLNMLQRSDYLALFGERYTLLGDHPDDQAGRSYLTPEIAAEFARFSAAELCATGWTYVVGRPAGSCRPGPE